MNPALRELEWCVAALETIKQRGGLTLDENAVLEDASRALANTLVVRVTKEAPEMYRILNRVLNELPPEQFHYLSIKTQEDLVNCVKRIEATK